MSDEEIAEPNEPAEDGQAEPQLESEPEPEPEPQPEPEAKPKKRKKINLKARLSSVRGTGSIANLGAAGAPSEGKDPLSFPPPPTSGVPAPRLPGVSSPSASSPFAAPVPEVKVAPQQQVIKVEVGEEIVKERAKTKKKTAVYVLIAAVVCLAAGWQVGIAYQRGREGFKAVAGAKGLSTDIDEANKSLMTLSDALRGAVEKLGQEEYPDELIEVLKSTNVPFTSANFQGRGVGGLGNEILTPLLRYTSGVEDLNKQKDKLRNLLGAAKPAVEKFVKEKKAPVVNFSIIFEKKGGNIVALLVPNKPPFKQKEKYPATYKIIRPEGKKVKEVEVERYLKGDVISGDKKISIPVMERSVAAFTSRKLVFALRKALADTKSSIDGQDSPNPALQTDGLLKEGERLIENLNKVSAAGG